MCLCLVSVMAKTAVKKQKKRTDLPYSERMMMARNENIFFHRDDAARSVLMLAMVALNDTEQMGYTRLLRFVNQLRPMIQEYYEDRERMHEHVRRRLEGMGFVVRGNEVYPKEAKELLEDLTNGKDG